THDNLTKLANRLSLFDKLSDLIKLSRRNNYNFAILFIDVDKFKEINDLYGHAIGDHILLECADRLARAVRATDIIARLGGDEFVIILTNLSQETDVERVSETLIESFSEAFIVDENHHYLGISIGITLYPKDAIEADELINKADYAMYFAKQQGGNIYKYYTEELNQQNSLKKSMLYDLQKALDNNEFTIYYQPIINSSTNIIRGFEVLIGWVKKNKIILPIEFIKIAEDNGLTVPIGEWLLESIIQEIANNTVYSDLNLIISINISMHQLLSKEFYQKFEQLLAKHKVNGRNIEIEITENILQENSKFIANILY
ncbi:MAG: bifunctional diguanylate cyclase/phosphodiesterase, partial [Romboutsia sp.]|nr:bifunctional diguanylate cyclase/phosphodiesterase [Romboutsia sp.]